jgi:hypothetical protein
VREGAAPVHIARDSQEQRVYQFCSVMDDVTIAIDDNFFDAGDTMKASYGDIDTPPNASGLSLLSQAGGHSTRRG